MRLFLTQPLYFKLETCMGDHFDGTHAGKIIQKGWFKLTEGLINGED